jgi:hypothetical protein
MINENLLSSLKKARTPLRVGLKKITHIEYAYEKGVRLFVSDPDTDFLNLALTAPKSRILIHISSEDADTADWRHIFTVLFISPI